MKKAMKITGIIAVVAILCVCLVACIPNDYSKAEKNLNDADYIVVPGSEAAGKVLGIAIGCDEVKAVVTATNGEDGIIMVYFDSTGAAKDNYEKVKEYYTKKDTANKDRTIKRSGKVIYIGTDAAIKAAK